VNAAQLQYVLHRFPELRRGLPVHTDEVLRMAGRILELEANSSTPPRLPASAAEWETSYWERRRLRKAS
jgi:hypothetical protein